MPILLLILIFTNYIQPMKKDQNPNNKAINQKSGLYLRSRILFVSVITILTIFLIWPGYTLFAASEPLILGFPLSFAWVIFCTIIGFIALYFLYISDNKREEQG